MKTKNQIVQYAAAVGAALILSAMPAPAQECPEFVGLLDLGCSAHDVELSPGYAYVACADDGLAVVDVTDPSLPVEVAGLSFDNAEYLAVHGTHAFVTESGDEYPFGMDVLNVIDISTPSAPERVGHWDSGAGIPIGPVAAVEGYVYVARLDEVVVIDVRVPSDPTLVGQMVVGGYGDVLDVAVGDDYAYVLYHDGFFIFDVTDPSQAYPLGSYMGRHPYFDHFRRLAVDPTGHAYVTRSTFNMSASPWFACLDVIDVTDPANPVQAGGTFEEYNWYLGVAVSGGYAYVTQEEGNSLYAFNVSNVSDPYWVGSGDTWGPTEELAAGWGYVYVADGDAGLTIFRECGPFYDGFESGDATVWSSTNP